MGRKFEETSKTCTNYLVLKFISKEESLDKSISSSSTLVDIPVVMAD